MSLREIHIHLPEVIIAGDGHEINTAQWSSVQLARLIQAGLCAHLDAPDERVIRAQAALERALLAQRQKVAALSNGQF
jgi:hypothetical protein